MNNNLFGKVWFVGAGPGDPELITVKGRDLIAQADAILFAGSLVSETTMRWAKPNCIIEDSKGKTLQEITQWLIGHAKKYKTVLRLQTGDPGLYGALIEMVQELDQQQVEVTVIPGVSSAMAAAAVGVESLTLPEITQTVILTRVEGRTPMPVGESLAELAAHHATLCIFLSITLLKKVQQQCLAAGWSENAPVLVVQKASWPDQEKIVRGTLKDIRELCIKQNITSQAMIIISPTLGARYWTDLKKSKLYDEDFSHKFRKAKVNNKAKLTITEKTQ